jgi:hypothetical protein
VFLTPKCPFKALFDAFFKRFIYYIKMFLWTPFIETYNLRGVPEVADFLKGIERFGKIVGGRCSKGYVLYNGHEQYTLKETRILNPIVHGGLEAHLL